MNILKEYEDTVLISKETYKFMQMELAWLECLRTAGLDNWDGCSDAAELLCEMGYTG